MAMKRRDPDAPNPIAQMVQQAHAGEMDVAAPPQGDSSAPPIQPEPTAPRDEAPSPEEPAAAPDPEASTLRRVVEQRDKARGVNEAKDQEILNLQEQLRQMNGQQDLRKYLSEVPAEEPMPDESEARVMQAAQAGAKYGYEQAMAGIDSQGIQRLTMKEKLRTELGGEVSNSQLDAMTDVKWTHRGLSAEQTKMLATAERPELFDAPMQSEVEVPVPLPASHRVQQPTSESRRVSEPTEPTAEEKFAMARRGNNRKGMRTALGQILTETLIAPALGSMPHDGSGRIVMKGERLHIKSPRKG